MRAKVTAAAAVVAAILLTVPALAQPPSVDAADRALIHSYDSESMQLFWATVMDASESSTDPCNAVQADTSYDYTITPEGDVTVTDFEDCTFNVTDVTGPNGQVNHGTVVSNFVKALKDSDYTGSRGCMIRIIAQSEYGKGDDQVKVSETTPTSEPPAPTEVTGSTSFTVTETTCGKPDNPGKSDEEHGKSDQEHGKSDQVHGQSQESHGKPANPGHSGEHGNPNH